MTEHYLVTEARNSRDKSKLNLLIAQHALFGWKEKELKDLINKLIEQARKEEV